MTVPSRVNVFEILGLRRHEDPHDRMLAWLCAPDAGHGLSDFAARIVSSLWDVSLDESVRQVKQQYQLASDSWPDVVVTFDRSLFVIENKVNSSALTPGQLERQHELALAQQEDNALYHVLLCPDMFNVEGYGPDSSSFKVLKYSRLAAIARQAIEGSDGTPAAVIVKQYADYIESTFGKALPAEIRIAPARILAKRNTEGQVWSEEKFLDCVAKYSSAVQQSQAELLDLLKSMECVEPRFDSAGPTNATYKVYFVGTKQHPLWVYEDGRLYVQWGTNTFAGPDAVAEYKELWKGLVDPEKKDGMFAVGGLVSVGVEGVASRLQRISDFQGFETK